MLQPSLAGNARISVICTINPDPSAVGETSSTLGFAKRVKGVKLNAHKKEIVDTDALIERYPIEIDDLKKRLADNEAKMDESKAMKDLNDRIQQLTKLILTSNTVEESASESRPASPVKVDFDLSPYQLQQELLSAKLQLETQSRQILSLEAALEARAADEVSDDSKDKLISEQAEKIKELEGIVRGGDIGGVAESMRRMKEEVEKEMRAVAEKEWTAKVEEEKRKREEGERWAEEVVKQLEKEKQVRIKLEDERRALAAFVSKFDALVSRRGSSIIPPMPSPRGAAAAFEERKQLRNLRARKNPSSDQLFPFPSSGSTDIESMTTATSSSTVSSTETDLNLRSSIGEDNSPVRLGLNDRQLMLPSLLEEDWGTIMDSATGMPGDISF
ncbi:hypothetical protein MPER_07593 [Moniliophthora perniciosa FA553]|nr:hypothetical protein MPER_07593 [Moniliophthora perniciosa FA553]